MSVETDDLPYVDEHRTTVDAPRAAVWTALRRYAASLGVGAGNPLALLLGTVPPTGFAEVERVPNERLGLAGRHRFSRYLLVFELADAANGSTTVRARSYAAFPGPHGRLYRALVIGSGGHVVAVRGMLREIRRRSLR
ncbi:hypothetical protein Sru01_49710 [Sphaerisporangium rufum]|uniref:DUF2867 domain-containing protein n=1 Tax=Sphaerisporangium rufum TaxID=1381558 RepID=A0A919R5F2_9ACTN|nr:hypothetical protein [Sphaerisporangium rufum]GII79989.1 hypothetical protein Sru01_49710 [Sphaerisporangium rufum]